MYKNLMRSALLTTVALFAGAAHGGTAINASAFSRADVTDLGPAPADTQVSIAVVLPYRNQAELEALVVQQATPGSPQYHRFLSAAQFAERFGPTQAQHDAIVGALQRAGFTITRTYANRTVIDATASAGVAGAYFGAQFHRVNQYGHGERYANATPATLPKELASGGVTVLGLDNVVKMRTHNVGAQDVINASAQAATKPASQPIERLVNNAFAGLYPAGLAAAYNYPSLKGFTGAGHAIAIVIDSDITNSDLSTFWTAAGVTRTGAFNRIYIDKATSTENADVSETAIDTETTSSLAPAANIDLYVIPNLDDQAIEDAYTQAVATGVDDVVSSSFGGCELPDEPFAAATDAIALQGAAKGMTFTASTGDEGGDCPELNSRGKTAYALDIVNSPASGPHFVAVGGTRLQVNKTTGARTSEVAWSPGGASGGGGGGVSSYWPIPSWQVGVTGMAVVPNVKNAAPLSEPVSGFAGRNMPDISLDASNATGSYVAVYDTVGDGGWSGYGGTSVSNPVFAALVAEQNQATGSLSGLLTPALYATFTSNGTKPAGVYGVDFYDVTSGSIGAGWSAKAGYDQATGIGSILGGAY